MFTDPLGLVVTCGTCDPTIEDITTINGAGCNTGFNVGKKGHTTFVDTIAKNYAPKSMLVFSPGKCEFLDHKDPEQDTPCKFLGAVEVHLQIAGCPAAWKGPSIAMPSGETKLTLNDCVKVKSFTGNVSGVTKGQTTSVAHLTIPYTEVPCNGADNWKYMGSIVWESTCSYPSGASSEGEVESQIYVRCKPCREQTSLGAGEPHAGGAASPPL